MNKDTMQYTIWTAIFREALGRSKAGIYPRIVGPGWIDAAGVIHANVYDREKQYFVGVRMYDTIEFRDMWRHIADRAGLSDQERTELFDKLRGWIARDYRVSTPLSASDKDPS